MIQYTPMAIEVLALGLVRIPVLNHAYKYALAQAHPKNINEDDKIDNANNDENNQPY